MASISIQPMQSAQENAGVVMLKYTTPYDQCLFLCPSTQHCTTTACFLSGQRLDSCISAMACPILERLIPSGAQRPPLVSKHLSYLVRKKLLYLVSKHLPYLASIFEAFRGGFLYSVSASFLLRDRKSYIILGQIN